MDLAGREPAVSKFWELLPYVFYMAGSACFVIGTAIAMWRVWHA